MPIRKVAAQVSVTRDGKRAAVPPMTPFNFTEKELADVKAADANLIRTATDAEVKGATQFHELKGIREITKPAVPVNTQAVETAPVDQTTEIQTFNDDELEQKTVKELKELATNRKIEVPNNANKADLKTLILEDQAAAEDL